MFLLFEILRVAIAALMGIFIIGKLVLILRCVIPQDKALAVASTITFIGLISYLPVRIIFVAITRKFQLYFFQIIYLNYQ